MTIYLTKYLQMNAITYQGRHLQSFVQRAHHLSWIRNRRRTRQPNHRSHALPRPRGLQQTHLPLHKLPRRIRHFRSRHLRRHATHQQ